MMNHMESTRIEMIPIDRITVINPRVRNQKQHQEIIDSIKNVGLKKPITVSRRKVKESGDNYDLVCGQGRLEAFIGLEQKEIPAIVIDADEEECLLKSLIENVARRQHSPIELMQEIGNLKRRGYSDIQIASKVGVTASWVTSVASLLKKGEQRLVSAVETNLIPLSLAVDIAKSDDADVQAVLADAYTKGILRGKKLQLVRRLLEQRARGRKASVYNGPQGKHASSKKLTPDQLLKVYETEAERQRILIKKSELVQNRILFVVQVFKELLGKKDGFQDLLHKEGLGNLPRQLHSRIE